MTPETSTLGVSTVKEERVTGVGGVQLLVRSWRPEQAPRGIVAIVPGFNSHSGYYFWTAEQFVAAGFAVYAVDLRGRGLSEGERFYVESVGEYVHDVATLVTLAKSREPGLPLYMQISKYGCVLHLSEHYGDATPGASVFLRVTGKLMQLTDPFGNRLRFNEDLK